MCFPFRLPSSAAARMAQLSLSVPQEVNTTSSGRQPSPAATSLRHCFTRSAAWLPRAWRAEGLPHSSVMAFMAAWAASMRTGVVAALSK